MSRGQLAAVVLLSGVLTAEGAEEGRALDPARVLGILIEQRFRDRPEWGDMVVSILKGEAMDPGKGWWRPGASTLGWGWLRASFDADLDGKVQAAEMPPGPWVDRLDRDRDGRITAADLDRSAGGPGMVARVAGRLFRRWDVDTNGRITRAELSAFFDRADRDGLGFLTPEDIRDALLEPGEEGGGGEDPSPWGLLYMLMSGQLGSFREGPRPGDPAPDFRLPTDDGKGEATLSASRGKKPVVLVFGSFT